MWRSLRPPLVFWLVWALGSIVTFLVTGVIFDMAQVLWHLVLLRYLDSIEPGGWMASMASLTTAIVFLGSLGLRLISGDGGVVGLSLVFILGGLILGLPLGVFFLCRQMMTFWAPGINFPNVEG